MNMQIHTHTDPVSPPLSHARFSSPFLSNTLICLHTYRLHRLVVVYSCLYIYIFFGAGIFRAMDGCHVTIRLLDPPLHEFLPSGNMEDVCAMIASGEHTHTHTHTHTHKRTHTH